MQRTILFVASIVVFGACAYIWPASDFGENWLIPILIVIAAALSTILISKIIQLEATKAYSNSSTFRPRKLFVYGLAYIAISLLLSLVSVAPMIPFIVIFGLLNLATAGVIVVWQRIKGG